ncbi:MAG: XdhC family protein, partial [Immundisolibacteraceae bacterium]|nr:XdhC family protein [Immundisolibacteraceae bacterium]
MNSTDIEVVNQIVSWLELRQPTYLVTVVETWGSSPRPVGAMAAIRNGQELVGSVSGGCVEEDLLGRIANGEFSGTMPTSC